MATMLRIDPRTLPRTLALHPPVSDAEFEAMCRENGNVRFERTREGIVRMNAPAGGWTSDGNAEICFQLRSWWAEHERGRVFDSSGGFRLPDGSTLSPDAAYVSLKRLKSLPKGALRGFPRVCPDFVIELLSESDSREALQSKMTDWITNGAELAWLIDPYKRKVHIYRPANPVTTTSGPVVAGAGPVEGFSLAVERVWKCYADD